MLMKERASFSIAQSPLLRAVRDFLAAREDTANRPLYCALSGGADSVALACALWILEVPFTALHVNFGLRGAESDGDEAFVREFCRLHDIPLHVRYFDTREEAAQMGESLEMAARRLRYAWFAELDGAVCVAHHLEDQAETLLLRLLRGAGLRGLAAMRAVRADGVWRPLLQVRKAEILAFLADLQQPYATDSSNADTQFRRNFVRHRLMPPLREMNPSVDTTLAATAEHLQEALSVYEVGMSLLDAELLTESPDGRTEIDLDAVRRRGAAGREWLRERLVQRGFSPEVSAAVLTARTGALFTTAEVCAVVHGERLLMESDTLPPLPVIEMRRYDREETFAPARAADCVTLDADAVVGSPFVRRVQTGDRFAPFGMRKGTKLVSDYLTNRHRSVLEKRAATVVCDEVGILWLVGETVDRRVAVTASTCNILEIRLSEEGEG